MATLTAARECGCTLDPHVFGHQCEHPERLLPAAQADRLIEWSRTGHVIPYIPFTLKTAPHKSFP